MRQNTKKKRLGFGYFIRMFLLLVELLAVTLFLWGNDAYSISATTPEFKWENYKTIAHALGGIGTIPRTQRINSTRNTWFDSST